MDNPVVIRITEVAQTLGLATLRFNFRGVGSSSGVHGGGEAEREDLRTALGVLAGHLPVGVAPGLAGYSFGAWVSARVAAEGYPVPALALVAPPLQMRALDFLDRTPGPTLLVAGTRDQYCAVNDLERLGQRLGAEVAIIKGAEHFFFGKLFPMGQAVERWLQRWSA